MRAVDAIMECLKAEGVEHVFGIPGGANLPTYDALYDAGVRHIHAAARSVKANFRVLPAQSLAELTVSLDNVVTDTAFGDNAIWSTRGFVFTATRTNTVLD